MSQLLFGLLLAFSITGCVGPQPGPDKQGEGMLTGAVYGAGAGAITGAQLASATGPGALAGAGFGAVVGSIRGFAQDQFEDELMSLSEATRREREVAFAQEVLADHYERRKELHPTRDLFPADLFFRSDGVTLRPTANAIIRELVKIHIERSGWSRFVIASYVKSSDPKSKYAMHLAERRAEALGAAFTQYGFEPRRIQARGVIVKAPVLIDPLDNPRRYNAAIELIPVDY